MRLRHVKVNKRNKSVSERLTQTSGPHLTEKILGHLNSVVEQKRFGKHLEGRVGKYHRVGIWYVALT